MRALAKFGISQVGILRQQGDTGDIAYLGIQEEIVVPFVPKSGIHSIYRDKAEDTVIRQEVIDAIRRRFSIQERIGPTDNGLVGGD